MGVRTIKVPGLGTPTLTFVWPAGVELSAQAVYAAIDATAAGAVTATLTVTDVSGAVIAKKRQPETVSAGATGSATWALRLDDSPAAGAAYETIQDEGVALTQRRKLNFVGAGVTAADDAGNARTNVTIPSTDAYVTVQDEGADLTQRRKLNFVGAGVTAADDAGNARTNVTIPAANVTAGLYPPFEAGYWYGPQDASFGSASTAVNVLLAQQFWVPTSTAFDRIGILTSGNTSNSVRLGVYSNTHGYPDALLLDSGQFSVAGVGVREVAATITLTLAAGVYWLAHVNQVGVNPLYATNNGNGGVPMGVVTATALTELNASTAGFIARSSNTVSGALPNPFGTRGTWMTTASATVVWMRAV